MYLNKPKDGKRVTFDIETDGLNPTRIWCCVAKEINTGKRYKAVGHQEIKSLFAELKGYQFVGHNCLSFDFPALEKVLGIIIPFSDKLDSLTCSYLYFPGLYDDHGKHSLEAWGSRFGIPKLVHEDWDNYSPEMLERCSVDVDITERVFEVLTSRMLKRGFSEKSVELEHQIRVVVDEQERTGFYFDIDGAKELLREVRADQERSGVAIKGLFPPRLVEMATYKMRTRQDGQPYSSYSRHLGRYPKVEPSPDGSEYTVWDWQEFNIGSPPQRAERLLGLGWKPQKFTPTKLPKTDEDALVAFLEALEPGSEEYLAVEAMSGWIVDEGRATMIEGWLRNVNLWDHCIHGGVLSCGAASRRMTHFSPNTANIPKAKKKVKYGIACRSLWQARPGRRLIGYDAKALEMMMFCHFLNNPEVTKLYTEGDPHRVNADALSANAWGFVAERDTGAKNGFYAFIYGAQDPKLGSTLDPTGTAAYGAWARKKLFEITPGLEGLVRNTQQEYYDNGGFLKCVDGGFVRCPSPHSAINYKFQPAGAILMKQASVFLNQRLKEEGIDAKKVCDVHDEGQLDTAPNDCDRAGRLAVRCIEDAAGELNFNVPVTGTYKEGSNWAETH